LVRNARELCYVTGYLFGRVYETFCIDYQYKMSKWEDNIKKDLQEVGGGCGDCMELAQDRDRWRALVSTVRNLLVPKMRGIF
jgi:hypothetical protein